MGFQPRRWTVVFMAGLACAAVAGPDAALEDDLAFIQETVAGRLGMTKLARQALEAAKRRHPGGGGGRLELAEARLMTREAIAEQDAARRATILAEVRARLTRVKETASASGAVSSAGAEAALALARLTADVAEAGRSPEEFSGAAKELSALLSELDRLVERASAARAAREIDEAAFQVLDQKLFVLQAEVRYEYADVHLRWGRTLAAGDPKRAGVLEKAIEEFDNAALFTEDEAKPDMIFYPQPYLKKAACERVLGDFSRARETLTKFLARKVQHPDGPNARNLARQQLADMFLSEKNWELARKTAADMARDGQADMAAVFQSRAAIEQGRESTDAPAKKAADEGFSRLEQIAARRGPVAQEAADWLRRYREGVRDETPSATAGLIDRAKQAEDQKNFPEAIRLYREALAGAEPAAWRAGAPRAWFGIALCHYQTENYMAAASAFAQAAEYPGADEKIAVSATEGVEGALAKWAVPLAQGEALLALVKRHTRRVKESVAARFPGNAKVQHYHAELGDAALKEGNAALALAFYRKVSGIEPRWSLAALEGIVEAERRLLADRLKAAGSRFPADEEAGPLAAALDALVAWIGGPEAQKVEAAARQGAYRRGVSQATFHLALALPAKAIAAMDGFRKAFPDAPLPPEWAQIRCVATARQGDLAGARSAWTAIRAALGTNSPPKSALATANVLGRVASDGVRVARSAGNDKAAREGALWVTELLTFTLGVKENPSEAEVAELVNRFEWQTTKTQEYMTAVGIGEFLLDRADAWKLSGERRLRVLTGLADAYWAVEDWSQAMRISRDLDAAYEKKGQLARWARKRVAESARKIAERATDPVARNKACLEWYEAAKHLRGVTPDGSADWWDCSYEMGLVPVLQGEPGLLRDYLANLFGIAPDLGGEAMRGRFADLAVWAWRRGDEKQRPFAAQLLEDMWARSASWKDPAAARFIR